MDLHYEIQGKGEPIVLENSTKKNAQCHSERKAELFPKGSEESL